MLIEISQSEKYKYCMIPLIWGPRTVKITKTESRMVVVKGLGEREMRNCLIGIDFLFQYEKGSRVGCW